MTVFKNYLKVAKTFLPTILIYSLIFFSIATMTSISGTHQGQSYEAEKSKIAVINHDNEIPFIQSFMTYIQDNAEYVEIEDSEAEMRDALFFRKVDYIMIIPEDFTDSFLKHQDIQIETMEVPDSSSATYSKQLMNKYLNTAQFYLKGSINEKEIAQYVQKDLAVHSQVEMLNESLNSELSSARNFYNFANFTFLAIIIVVVSMVMISFHEEKIHRRHLISCLSYRNLNFQLLLGNVLTTMGIWLLYVFVSLGLYREAMMSNAGVLLILNSFVFIIFILVFSFFLSTLTHNREIISMVSTVFSLGTSFIAGAFVPQELLAPFVLNIAKFTPSYWFITNNNKIAQMSHYTVSELKPLFVHMGIILCFTVAFYFATQVVSRMKLKK